MAHTRFPDVASCKVAIVGAGPYGLAAAAHLRAANVETTVFGEAMEFWQRRMPKGMFLRSGWEASHLSDPHRALTLDRYQADHGIRVPTPIPLADFVEYGHWFRRQAVPDLDRRRVTCIYPIRSGFRLALEDGESCDVHRVVIAAGITPFAWRPLQFGPQLGPLVSHSSDHDDLSVFAGRQVAVIGGGQSAVESAALLGEAGADVELLVRAPRVRWLGRGDRLRRQPRLIRSLFYPPTDVGPPGLNLIVAAPELFRRLPRRIQDRIAYRSIRPAASAWLRPRVDGVRISSGRIVVSATPVGGRLRLILDDGSERWTDHALLATGYRVDVSRYDFLSPQLLGALRRAGGYPRLGPGLESSVAGLHFLGAPAAWSFGPLLRFVSGTEYAARALTRRLLQIQGEPSRQQYGVGGAA